MSRSKSFAPWMTITVFVLGLTTAAVSAQDWPRYRHNAARTAAVEEPLSFPLHPRWVYEPDRRPRPAWPDPVHGPNRTLFDYAPVPVVANGLLYCGSTTDDSVRALDAGSGEVRWRFTTGGPVRFAPDISEGRAYFGSDDGYLYCLDARTGELVWRFHASRTNDMVLGNERMISRRPLRSGVLVDDGVVYTTAGMWPAEGVIVYALDAGTGEVIWANDTNLQYMEQPHAPAHAITGVAPQGYLALGENVLLVAAGRAVPGAFDRTDGRFLYYRHRDNQHGGSAWLTVDAAGGLFVNARKDWTQAFDLSTGERADGSAVRYVPEGAVRAGEVLVKGDEGRVTAEGADWAAEIDGYARRLAVADGRLYVSTDTGRIYCFAPGEPAAGGPTVVRPSPADAAEQPGPLAREMLALLAERRLDRGYALVLGEPEPNLAQALASATEMHVLQVLGSEEAARKARERLLDSTHLYGSRVAVTHMPAGGGLPFPPYFANVIVGGPQTLGVAAEDVHRVLRPAGGLWLPGPGWAPPDELELQRVAREDSTSGVVLERGKLAGAFDWDSEAPADERLRWPLALAWFGGPGPARMVDRHVHGPIPIAANGRYFHIGNHYVTAVDAYNGTELWFRYVPFAFRARRIGGTIRSLSADDENVYLGLGSAVYRLDARTGHQLGVYGSFDEPERHALDGPKRFEFTAPRNDAWTGALTLTPGEDGLRVEMQTQDAVVSDFDMWELYFDFRPPGRRADLYEAGDPDVFRVVVQARTGKPFPWLAPRWLVSDPDRVFWHDRLYFTRSRTGDLYSVPTQNYEVPAGVVVDPDDPAVRLGMKFEGGAVEGGTTVRALLPWAHLPAAADGPPAEFAFTATLLSCDQPPSIIRTHAFDTDDTAGTLNNGWPVFVLDETAADPQDPEVGSLADLPERALEWGRAPTRPAQTASGPTAFTEDMRTAQPYGRDSLNGQFYRRSYGCGPVVTAAGMDIFRSATLALYDLNDAGGIHHFGGIRPGCGTAPLAALGLLIASESSSGCSCGYNFQTSLALAPADRRPNEDWAVYFERVELGTRLNRTAVNLGAPGDRRDDDGLLWVGYPRDLRVQAGDALALPLVMERDERFGPLRINSDLTRVEDTDKPWVYGSCMRGVRRIDVDLRYRDPRWSALSLSEPRPPTVDGVLDDASWDGSQRVVLPDGGTVQLRHDAENLYLGYQRPASLYRPGRSPAWGVAPGEGETSSRGEDPVGLRLASARPGEWGDFLRFAVSATGKQDSSQWPSTAEVPRVEDLTLDGRAGDWDEKGFVARVVAGVESRFAWDERGLWILTTIREDAMTDEKMPPWFTLVAAPLEELPRDQMRLRIDLKDRTWEAVHVQNYKDVSDVVQVRESKAGGLHVIEALMPIEKLGIEPRAGVEMALPMFYEPFDGWPSYFVSRPAQQNVFRRPANCRSLARLRLAERASAPRSVVFSIAHRLPVASFAVDKTPFPGEWKSAVRRTNEQFTAEMAIPWSDIERFGFERDALMLNFDPSPTPEDNIQALQHFDERARTFHLDDSPPEQRRYTVRLHFAELDEQVSPGDRVFDVALQGETVLEGLDVAAETGDSRRALVREFRGVPAERNLRITFIPRAEELTAQNAPILSGLDIVAEEDD